MPARGDHEQHRRDIVRIAGDLIAEGGLAAATHRRIAEASGASTTVVSHYFHDKRDLVMATYRQVGERVAERLQVAADSPHPLRPTLDALLPLDRQRVRDWRVLFAFLGPAATDVDLTAEERVRLRAARARVRSALAVEVAAGCLPAGTDADAVARGLLAVVLGTGMQALFDPSQWSRRRIDAVVGRALADTGLDHCSG
ncbi:TetR/AcrR family transcriptional regulator [Jatrophihabitans fulvus]